MNLVLSAANAMDSDTLDTATKHAPKPRSASSSFFTEGLWIEGAATAQFEHASRLEGVVASFAMPDLHPGKGIPIGCSVVTRGLFYPHLAGNDIGCGVFCAELVGAKRQSPDTLAKARWFREEPDLSLWSAHLDRFGALWSDKGLDPSRNARTLGGGNHFLEIGSVEQIYGDSAGLALGALLILVHSGSRHLGEAVARSWSDAHGARPALEGSAQAQDWLGAHEACLDWAQINRLALARSGARALSCDLRPLSDTVHNAIEALSDETAYQGSIPPGAGGAYVHRKGASKADGGLALLPGSRGDFSYLLRPLDVARSALSLAHGAGRKWARSDCKGRLARFTPSDLAKTKLGSRVQCSDKELLFEEAPQAYKDCASVLKALSDHGLAEPVARIRPLFTLKI